MACKANTRSLFRFFFKKEMKAGRGERQHSL